jgi:hypothetical protein
MSPFAVIGVPRLHVKIICDDNRHSSAILTLSWKLRFLLPVFAVFCAAYEPQGGFRLKAQGCEERATLGQRPQDYYQPRTGLWPFRTGTSCANVGHNPVGVDAGGNVFPG